MDNYPFDIIGKFIYDFTKFNIFMIFYFMYINKLIYIGFYNLNN